MVLFVIVVFFTLKRNLNYRSRFFTSISQLFSLFNFQGTYDMDLRPSREVRKRTSYFGKTGFPWWAQVDSNHRPYAYQAYALTT